jgi:hypothetical protein
MNNKTQIFLVYLCPGVIAFIVSLMAAYRVGADFNNDTMIKYGVLFGCFIFLCGLYVCLCQPLAQFVCSLVANAIFGNGRISTESKVTMETVEVGDDSTIEQVEAPTEADTQEQSLSSISASYSDRVADYANEQACKRAALLTTIDKYIDYCLPPFIHEKDMQRIHDEIHRWADNSSYLPTEGINPKLRLSSYDLRHFIWNIAERLSLFCKYDGETRAKFAKALFPIPLKDIEVPALKNFRIKTYSDKINLDVPERNKFEFNCLNNDKERAA